MRVFAAVTPSPEAVSHLAAALDAVRNSNVGRCVAELRWTQPQLWHLTLAFFGDIDDDREPPLQTRLMRVAQRHHAIDLQLSGAGAFGRPAQASVVWVGVAGPGDEPVAESAAGSGAQLVKLAGSCGAAGRRIGLDVEERRYRPHLTVARAKGRRPVDVRPVVAALAGYQGPSWTASELHLVRSHLGAQPRHEVLASWPLLPRTEPVR